MSEFPDTSNSLLLQVKNPQNAEAWEKFSKIYHPVIYRLAQGRGLQDVDALDLAQQVLIAVAGAIGRWEPKSDATRFRHWLRRVIRNATVNALSRKPCDLAVGGSSVHKLLLQHPANNEQLESQIEAEYRCELYRQAAEIVRADVQSSTWQVFELTVLDGQDVRNVAEKFGKPTGAIYTARSRVMFRLRQEIQKLENTNQ